MVTPYQVDDVRASALAEEIARRIESELNIREQLKVVVIRETRSVGLPAELISGTAIAATIREEVRATWQNWSRAASSRLTVVPWWDDAASAV